MWNSRVDGMKNFQSDVIVDVIDSSTRGMFNIRELWRHRELVYFFAWRDIKIKYKQTVLGFLWAILQPLMMMIIFTLFLGRVLTIDTHGLEYPVYVLSGLLMWNIFALGLTSAANSMLNNSLIIKKIYFPRIVIPISSVLVSLFDYLMAFVLFVPILIYYHQPVSWTFVWAWPLATLIAAMATLGPGSWLAALNIKYRDFKYVIPFVIQILFFASPVIYPLTIVSHPVLQYIIAASPMYAAIELFRVPLTGCYSDPAFLAISLTTCVLLLFGGIGYFARTERFFADFA
jgi:lipopolysaccharide transport system permease protein